MMLKVRILHILTTFTQVTARLKSFLLGRLLVLGLREGLIECATVYIKSEVILKNVYLTPKSKACNTLGVRRSKKKLLSANLKKERCLNLKKSWQKRHNSSYWRKWYFVTKIVLTYFEKQLFYWSRTNFEIRGRTLRICKNFEITRKMYSNSERSELIIFGYRMLF